MKSKLFKILIFMNIFTLLIFISASKQSIIASQGGFGVSGTFASYHYKVVLGERIDTPNVYVTFYNNYSKEITVNLFTVGPDGVEIILENDVVIIPALESLKVIISIVVQAYALPGDYLLGMTAEVIPDEIGGVQIVGSAQLRTNISIFGEAGRFSISIIDTAGNLFHGVQQIYRIDGDLLIPIGYSETSQYNDRVIPGDYVIKCHYNGILVAEKNFTIHVDDNLQIHLVAKTVLIKTFLVGPNFDSETGLLLSTSIAFGIENIYLPVTNVSVVLTVWYKTTKLDEIEMLYTSYLDAVSIDGRYTYMPLDGWKSGNYSFKLQLFQQSEIDGELNYLFDETDMKTYYVPKDAVKSSLNFLLTALITSSVGFVAVLTLLVLKNKKKIG